MIYKNTLISSLSSRLPGKPGNRPSIANNLLVIQVEKCSEKKHVPIFEGVFLKCDIITLLYRCSVSKTKSEVGQNHTLF